ncbi:hypothetical protein [Gryllotalpicola koreensis]|uniref:Uncharacterized protein n=1 Tax=Gryllotalpicola koreensis TaxID=993086 RepID=A0ABP8A324_9MICO
MAARQYATPDDFDASDYSEDDGGQPITVTQKALNRAAETVDSIARFAVYRTDANGMPVDAEVLKTLTAMTCAQAAFNQMTGDESGAGAAAGAITLGPLSLGGVTARDQAGGAGFAPKAVELAQRLRFEVANW